MKYIYAYTNSIIELVLLFSILSFLLKIENVVASGNAVLPLIKVSINLLSILICVPKVGIVFSSFELGIIDNAAKL